MRAEVQPQGTAVLHRSRVLPGEFRTVNEQWRAREALGGVVF